MYAARACSICCTQSLPDELTTWGRAPHVPWNRAPSSWHLLSDLLDAAVSSDRGDPRAANTMMPSVQQSAAQGSLLPAALAAPTAQAAADAVLSTPQRQLRSLSSRRRAAAELIGSSCDQEFAIETLEVEGPADEWLSTPASSLLLSTPADADCIGPDGSPGSQNALITRSLSWQAFVRKMSSPLPDHTGRSSGRSPVKDLAARAPTPPGPSNAVAGAVAAAPSNAAAEGNTPISGLGCMVAPSGPASPIPAPTPGQAAGISSGCDLGGDSILVHRESVNSLIPEQQQQQQQVATNASIGSALASSSIAADVQQVAQLGSDEEQRRGVPEEQQLNITASTSDGITIRQNGAVQQLVHHSSSKQLRASSRRSADGSSFMHASSGCADNVAGATGSQSMPPQQQQQQQPAVVDRSNSSGRVPSADVSLRHPDSTADGKYGAPLHLEVSAGVAADVGCGCSGGKFEVGMEEDSSATTAAWAASLRSPVSISRTSSKAAR